MQGRPTLVLELTNGSELKLASVAQPGIVAELADRLHGLTGRWDTPERVALVVPIRPGSQAQAETLLAAGPPFDPSEFGLVSHEVFVTEREVIFLFEGSPSVFAQHLAEDDSFWEAVTSVAAAGATGALRFASRLPGSGSRAFDSLGDHELFAGRHDLEREVAEEAAAARRPASRTSARFSPTPPENASTSEAAKGHGHVRRGHRDRDT